MATKERKEKANVWPQRARFKELYEQYRRRFSPRKPMELVAEELGIAYTTLYTIIYDPKRRPGLSVLYAASKIFQCDITEFVDNPNARFDGVECGEDVVAPEETRVAMRKLYSSLKKMNPQQIHDAMAVWEAATVAIRRLNET